METCPKCGYVRTHEDIEKPDDQCPSCGVYYEKALKAQEATIQRESVSKLQRKKRWITAIVSTIAIFLFIAILIYLKKLSSDSFLAVVISMILAISLMLFLLIKIPHRRHGEISKYINTIKDIHPAKTLVSADANTGVALDESTKSIYLIFRTNNGFTHKKYQNADLISSEIFEDGHSLTKTSRSSQITNAAIGGLLLGPVGALAGVIMGKQNTLDVATRIEIRLLLNDTKQPAYTIVFLGHQINKANPTYNMLVQNALHWNGIFIALIKQAENQ